MERKEEEEITAAIQCFVAMQQNCTRVAREFPFTVNEEEKEEEKEAKEVEEEKEEKEEEEEEEDEGVEITAIMQSSQQCRGIVHVGQGNCQVNKDKEKKEEQVKEDKKKNGKEITTFAPVVLVAKAIVCFLPETEKEEEEDKKEKMEENKQQEEENKMEEEEEEEVEIRTSMHAVFCSNAAELYCCTDQARQLFISRKQ